MLMNYSMYAKSTQCDLTKVWKSLCNVNSFQFVDDFGLLRNTYLWATIIQYNLIWCRKSMKNLVRFQHFQFGYDSEVLRNGGQMGAPSNIQIDPKIKSVDISLDQSKNTTLRKSDQKHPLCQNGHPDPTTKQKCWYFIRPEQKKHSPKSMHPNYFGLTRNCQMEVPREMRCSSCPERDCCRGSL